MAKNKVCLNVLATYLAILEALNPKPSNGLLKEHEPFTCEQKCTERQQALRREVQDLGFRVLCLGFRA